MTTKELLKYYNETDSYFRREWLKMLEGNVYDAAYGPFLNLLVSTRKAIAAYNATSPHETDSLTTQLRALLGKCGQRILINQPFRCDYGCNIETGENFMANFNFTVLDEALVKIGDNVFIGPNVSIYTACHPLDPDERRDGREWAESVTIGNDVWIGGNTVILPGASIGDGCTIGAGSVVRGNIPPRTMAAGNPAKVKRNI